VRGQFGVVSFVAEGLAVVCYVISDSTIFIS
jgi:hypothetical protein